MHKSVCWLDSSKEKWVWLPPFDVHVVLDGCTVAFRNLVIKVNINRQNSI